MKSEKELEDRILFWKGTFHAALTGLLAYGKAPDISINLAMEIAEASFAKVYGEDKK